MKILKKVLIAILVLIVALVTCYYAFPEKVAGYIMDAARCKAGLTKKEIKIDDHNVLRVFTTRSRRKNLVEQTLTRGSCTALEI